MPLSEYQKNRLAYINDGRPLPPKKKYVISKKSAKRIQKEKEQGIEIVKPKRKAGWFDVELSETDDNVVVEISNKGGGSELQRWFEDRRKELTGKCDNCGGKTCTDDKYYKFSIAHLLPKAYVKSVATHPLNFLELCHFGNGCHSQMDNKLLDLIDMNCFDKIIERVTAMYPHIAPSERRRIPAILMEYIKNEK